MSSNFGFLLEDYSNDRTECTQLLGRFLNQGNLGLMLGSGVSKAIKLPNWEQLVIELCNNIDPTLLYKPKDFTTDELKELSGRVKRIINDNNKYLLAVKKALYNGVDFNFKLAQTHLLVALSSLIIGKKRGNVQDIITLNFDSVLEWYLSINGLDVNVITKDHLLYKSSDINISHIHGYLPYEDGYGSQTDFIVFSRKEFEDRNVKRFDFWKDHYYEFFRRHVFLSIGMSADSLVLDVCPHLREMERWYASENILRGIPYGVAFLTDNPSNKSKEQDLLDDGVIPCFLEIDEIPMAVFEVAQAALKQNKIK